MRVQKHYLSPFSGNYRYLFQKDADLFRKRMRCFTRDVVMFLEKGRHLFSNKRAELPKTLTYSLKM